MDGAGASQTDGQAERAERFLALHHESAPLLLPNAWDVGSARLLEWLGFDAVATTSSGFAATLGRLDGDAGRDASIAHAAALAAATSLPVSADFENGFAHDPDGVAETARRALQAGVAGFSVEDFTGDEEDPIYDIDLAVERIRAAADVAHGGPVHMVLTGRAENYLNRRPDLADTIDRLRRYGDAGADVLYAPGLTSIDDIREVVQALDRPINVLLRPNGPSVAELAEVGVHRISVGGAFAYAALGALVDAGRELQTGESAAFFELAGRGSQAVKEAFRERP
jgi:2-methylisocitrate lyase-like PEP mutase family enzyme